MGAVAQSSGAHFCLPPHSHPGIFYASSFSVLIFIAAWALLTDPADQSVGSRWGKRPSPGAALQVTLSHHLHLGPPTPKR